MAENIDVAQAEARPAQGSVLDHLPMRDEEGQLRHEFVEEITRAIHAADRPLLCEVVAELHEADLGDLIEALEPDDRVTLVELTGTDFDFSALNEVDDSVREEILEELEPETVAEGVRELESDDAVELLEGLDEEDQEEILEKLPPSERDAAGAQPALSGKFRRPADAVRVHRGAAGLDRGPGDRLHARHARSAGPVLRDLRGRFRQALAGRGLARHAAARAPAGAARRADRRRPPPRLRAGRPGRGRADVRQVQPGRGPRRRHHQPAGRRHHHRRRRRRHRGRGRRGPEGARRRHQRRRTVRHCLDHRARAASTGCWSIWRPRFWRPPCSACSRASSRRWWRSRCWRRSWRARAATPRPRP